MLMKTEWKWGWKWKWKWGRFQFPRMEMGTVPISTYISVNDAIQKYILKS